MLSQEGAAVSLLGQPGRYRNETPTRTVVQ